MINTERFKKFSLLSIAPLAAASIYGGVALAGSSGGSSDSGLLPAVSEQAATPDTSRADAFISALAAKLGIDEQTLRDGLKSTAIDLVNQAVTDGKLTQAEADDAIARINESNGSFFGVGGFGGPGHHGPGPGGPAFIGGADLAAFLGIDEDTLHDELETDGATLASVAAAHGKSRDELKAFLTDSFNTAIDAKVASGDLAADEAAARKQDFAESLDQRIDSPLPVHGRNGHSNGDDDDDDDDSGESSSGSGFSSSNSGPGGAA